MITPYLCVADARRALDWYQAVLGARVTFEPFVMPDGRIGHAEITLADGAVVQLSEPFPELNVDAPLPDRGAAVTLHLQPVDVDAVTDAAASAGATIDRGPESTERGRVAVLRDPFGHRWMLGGPAA